MSHDPETPIEEGPEAPAATPPVDDRLRSAVAHFDRGDFVGARTHLAALDCTSCVASDVQHVARLDRALRLDFAPVIVVIACAATWLAAAWAALGA